MLRTHGYCACFKLRKRTHTQSQAEKCAEGLLELFFCVFKASWMRGFGVLRTPRRWSGEKFRED